MAAVKINAFTGNFDEVGVPLQTVTNTPALTTDGDIEVGQVGGNGMFYFRVNGVQYQLQGIPA